MSTASVLFLLSIHMLYAYTLYVDVFFNLPLPILLPDLIVYMNNPAGVL